MTSIVEASFVTHAYDYGMLLRTNRADLLADRIQLTAARRQY